MNPEVFENCSTILIDIAGTVGSINFTKDTLFTFAKKYIDEYLTAKWEDEEVKKLVAELKGDGEDLANVSKAVERFNSLTDENSVNTGLKTLQGLLYKQGYENGELKAHVFDDIKNAFEEWSKHRKICIYSTGTEVAQKQYFTHSTAGDLTGFIANYFDQSVGKKTASESYESIAKTLEVKPQEIVFLSDDIEEIRAAATAGCASVLVTREGNAAVSEDDKKDRMVVVSFADLPLSSKRKSEEDVSREEPPTKVAKIDTVEVPKAETTKEAKPEEAKEAMEVDSSESTSTVTTTDATASTPAGATPVAADTPMESEEAKTEPTSTDSTKVESTTEVAAAAPDTTATDSKECTNKVEKTEELATTTTTDAEEKMDDTPAPASTTTDSREEKTVQGDATKTEDTAVEKEAEAAVVTNSTEKAEVKPGESEEKPVEPESTPETTTPAIEEKGEVKQNGQENGEKASSEIQPEKVVEDNGAKTNGDAKAAENGDEKENKRAIANGTVETEEKKADDEVKPVTDEVKVKKIEETTEPAATLPVEA